MDRTRKGFGVAAVALGGLAVLAVLVGASIVHHINNDIHDGSGGLAAGIALLATIGYTLIGVASFSGLGIVSAVVGLIRRERKAWTVTGLCLNLALILAAAGYYVIAIDAPMRRHDEEWAERRRQFLETATPEQLLQEAVGDNNLSAAVSLLEGGADPNQGDPIGWPPLYQAVHRGQIDMVKCLLDHGAKGESALHHAADGRNLDIVKLLVEHGWDPRRRSKERNMTPLECARESRAPEAIVDYLETFEKRAPAVEERPNTGATK